MQNRIDATIDMARAERETSLVIALRHRADRRERHADDRRQDHDAQQHRRGQDRISVAAECLAHKRHKHRQPEKAVHHARYARKQIDLLCNSRNNGYDRSNIICFFL